MKMLLLIGMLIYQFQYPEASFIFNFYEKHSIF